MGGTRPENPLIVQSDHTVLLEVDHPRYEDARDSLLAFAELVKSPEHIHTYRLTPLSIWNARSAGLESEDGYLEVKVIGWLVTGERFEGTDTIKVISQRWRHREQHHGQHHKRGCNNKSGHQGNSMKSRKAAQSQFN